MQEDRRQEALQRRSLNEELLDLKGVVRVLCRVRPELPGEPDCGPPAVQCLPGQGEIDVFAGRWVSLCALYLSFLLAPFRPYPASVWDESFQSITFCSPRHARVMV